MHPLLSRLIVALACVAGGGLAGWLAGAMRGQATAPFVIGGALICTAAFAARDAVRALSLLRWLRDPSGTSAPRDTGLWGELGYRIERALRLREAEIARERGRLAQFLSAIEASPNGVVLLDAGDQIEWCNRVAADHFGLDPVRDLRQRVTNLVRAPAFVAWLQSDDEAPALQLPGRRGARTLQVVLGHYGDGQRLLLSQDITDRERAEAMRRDFVANVSHEMRTPLTVLAGFVETLQTLDLGAAERARVLALMSQQTGRMQALLADLLTLAQLEGSARPAADRWHDAAALLARVVADGRALSAGRHEISVAGGEGIEIAGDRNELLSALGNLVNNAVRYTPAGGRIDVRCALRDSGAAIEVADTGIGIAREHIPRLTERFYRVDGSRSRETGGTGLGLAIVKHVAQRHGGEVDVESAPGRGSKFRLLLPAARVRSGEAAADTAQGRADDGAPPPGGEPGPPRAAAERAPSRASS